MKRLASMLSFLIIGLLLMQSASAIIQKEFDPEIPVHGKISIINCPLYDPFCWVVDGDPVVDYTLQDYNQDCLLECHAEGTVQIHEPSVLYDSIKFLDKNDNERNLFSSKVYIKEYYNTTLSEPIFQQSCTPVVEVNGTSNQCVSEVSGSSTRSVENWRWAEYSGAEMPVGNYSWRIEAKKNPALTVDWVLEAHGEDLEEWAWWNATYPYCFNLYVNNTLTTPREGTVIDLPVNVSTFANLPYLNSIRVTNDSCGNAGAGTREIPSGVYRITQSLNMMSAFNLVVSNVTMAAQSNNTYGVYYSSFAVSNGNQFNITASDAGSGVGRIRVRSNNFLTDMGYNTNAQTYFDGWLNTSVYNGTQWNNYTNTNTNEPYTFIENYLNNLQISNTYRLLDNSSQNVVIQRNVTNQYNITYNIYSNGYAKVYVQNDPSASPGYYSFSRQYSGLSPNKARYLAGTITQNDPIGNYAGDAYSLASGAGSVHHILNVNQTNATAEGTYRTNTNSAYWIADDVNAHRITNNHTIVLKPVLNTNTTQWTNIIQDLNNPITAYSFGGQQELESVDVVLISPPSATITTNGLVTFNASITGTGVDVNATNATLYVWYANGTLVNTNFTTTINNKTAFVSRTLNLSEENYLWNYLGASAGSVNSYSKFAPANFTLRVDTNPVQLTLNRNLTDFYAETFPTNVLLNYTATDVQLSSCFYNSTENPTLTIITCNQSVLVPFTTPGIKTLFFGANDTAGTISLLNRTFEIGTYSTYVNNPVVAEGDNALFTLELNKTGVSTDFINATLRYNNTLYAYDNITNPTPDRAVIQKLIEIPLGAGGSSSNTIYWNWTFSTNSTGETTTTTKSQTVLFLTPLVVATACNDKAMAFNVLDEQNLTGINVDVAYNIQYGLANDTLKTTFGSISNTNVFYICINSTVSNAYRVGYGEIDYQIVGGGSVLRRYYLFNGKILSNTTENVTLYDLSNAAATSFLIEAKDNTLTPYVQKYLGLLRWYPQLNTYNLVEMALTDANGRSIFRVKTEDVDYRVALWELNGSLIKLNDVTRFACLTQPCTYSFTVIPGSQDFTSITGIEQSLVFNQTTSKFHYIWNDPSGRTQTMNMTVYHTTGLNVGPICEVVGTGSIGSIQSCDVSGYTGNVEAVVLRSASPPTPIATLIATLGNAISSVSKDMGLFLTVILAIAGFFIGIPNPVLGIIIQLVALLPSLFLGAITISVIIGFAIMGSVVLHFIKRLLGG